MVGANVETYWPRVTRTLTVPAAGPRTVYWSNSAFPFLKKGGCLVALGLGLGDVLGSRAGLKQSKLLARVHQHGIGDARIALDN